MRKKISLDAHTIKTTGGRDEQGFGYEKNDCTVRAYSLATGLTYKESHDLLEKFGRKPKKGIPFILFIKSEYNDFGYTINKVPSTPAKFIKENPVGKFICQIHRHVFAVIDGKIHDLYTVAPKKRINYSIEIFK